MYKYIQCRYGKYIQYSYGKYIHVAMVSTFM